MNNGVVLRERYRERNGKLIIANDTIGHVNLSSFNMQLLLVQNNKLIIQITWNGRGRVMYINKCNGNINKMKLKGGKKTRVTIL